jgi:hypothetical protein
MDGKLRNRPTMFMNSVRPKSAVFKFNVWPQKRSQNLSYNPAQTRLKILPISGVLEGQMTWHLVSGRTRQFPTTFMKNIDSNFMSGKIRWLQTTFMRNTLPNSEWINVISSSQSAWVLLSTKSTKSIVGHYINNQLPNE